MFVVDTNVLVHAADGNSPHHARCRQVLERLRRGSSAWYLTWSIIYEFLRVTTHARVARTPWTAAQAWRFIEALLCSPSLGLLIATKRHAAVVAEVLRETPHLGGNIMHDAHTAILMREHGILRIYTRDARFHRFPFLEPIDPVA